MTMTMTKKVRELSRLISVARGESQADLVLANARIINVFSGEVERGNVAICRDRIAGVGDYKQAEQVIDLDGKFLAPGFIDAHMHFESSLLDLGEYARAVVPRGTLGIATDAHAMANVCGLAGVRYVRDFSHRLPLELLLLAPPCVPATHNLESPGATLGVDDVQQMIRWKECIGLGELMDFISVINGDEDMMSKIALAAGMILDGHAPSVRGNNLNAYLAAGINSDHESVLIDEAREKLSRGMYVLIREGSQEENMVDLLPLVTDLTYKRCMFAVDDHTCLDLVESGDMDAVVRKAIRLGLDPVRAIQMTTINPANRFKLDNMGAVAPGYLANLIVLGDLNSVQVDMVYHRGRLVAEDGKALFKVRRPSTKGLTSTVNIKPFTKEDLKLKATGDTALVIELVPDQIITKKSKAKVKVVDGEVMPDLSRDILKLVVVERHRATGNIGVGLVKGFGLKKGALASSMAHDSHNVIAVGTDDGDISLAINEIQRLQGGLVIAAGGKVLASLPLPIAGLVSDKPLETVVNEFKNLKRLAKELGATVLSPFTAITWLALTVIPELRLSDLGMVDVQSAKVLK